MIGFWVQLKKERLPSRAKKVPFFRSYYYILIRTPKIYRATMYYWPVK